MGWRYTVLVWGKHHGEDAPYSNSTHWGGQSLLMALWQLVNARRLGYGCVTLECR